MEIERQERRWVRAGLLLIVTFWASAVPTMAVMTIPFILLAVVLPRRGVLVLVLAAVAVITTFTLRPTEGGLWWLERGWGLLLGGWFLAITMRWPQSAFITRALGAVAGSATVALAFFARRPSVRGLVDGAVTRQLQVMSDQASATLGNLAADPQISTAIQNGLQVVTELRGRFYPALLMIASVSGLGVAWWLYVRISQGSDRGLGPLREFRFNDQLIWVAVASVGLVLWGSAGPAADAGANGLIFMSALYAVRGAAVVVFVTGGVSIVGGLLLFLGVLLIPPYVLSAALFIGLGDTWLDVRARALKALGGGTE